MLYIDDEEYELSKAYKKRAQDVVEVCLEAIDFPYECEVYLLLTDNEGIQSINKEHRNLDKPTDVLSFPQIDFASPKDYDTMETMIEAYVNPETDAVVLGDIVISMERVKEQAEEYGHSLEREFSFMIVHSMLHLVGYDHIEENDEILMLKEQKEIMKHKLKLL